jgi:hypothetical protein
MALAFFRGGGIETTLSSLNLFFHAQQMIVATSGLYQLGAGAYTSPDGKGQFVREPRHIVLEDRVGVMSAKRLIDRVVELARIVSAGQEALNASQPDQCGCGVTHFVSKQLALRYIFGFRCPDKKSSTT